MNSLFSYFFTPSDPKFYDPWHHMEDIPMSQRPFHREVTIDGKLMLFISRDKVLFISECGKCLMFWETDLGFYHIPPKSKTKVYFDTVEEGREAHKKLVAKSYKQREERIEKFVQLDEE